jgi:hypothetical protein
VEDAGVGGGPGEAGLQVRIAALGGGEEEAAHRRQRGAQRIERLLGAGQLAERAVGGADVVRPGGAQLIEGRQRRVGGGGEGGGEAGVGLGPGVQPRTHVAQRLVGVTHRLQHRRQVGWVEVSGHEPRRLQGMEQRRHHGHQVGFEGAVVHLRRA